MAGSEKAIFSKQEILIWNWERSAENNWQNTMEEKILRLTDSFHLPFISGQNHPETLRNSEQRIHRNKKSARLHGALYSFTRKN